MNNPFGPNPTDRKVGGVYFTRAEAAAEVQDAKAVLARTNLPAMEESLRKAEDSGDAVKVNLLALTVKRLRQERKNAEAVIRLFAN